MGDKKRCIQQFTFYDKTGIQAYLEAQAGKGWMLEKISFCWVFHRIAPAKIHFSVTYFPKKSVFEAEPTEDQRLFWEFCEHTGWKLAATNEQMQIFYNEQENPVPIETDAAMEVEKIHSSARKTFLLNYVVLLLIFLLQIGSRISELHRDPLKILADNAVLLLLLGWTGFLVYIVRELIRYFRWHRKARIMAETEGIFAETEGIGKFWKMVPLFVIGVILLEMVFGDNGRMMHAFLVVLAMMAAFVILVAGISKYMKRRGVPAALNRLTVILLTALSCIAMTSGVFILVIKGELFPEREPVETYEYGGWVYEIYHDELPLRVEDMLPEKKGRYSCRLTERESLFLMQREARQDTPPDETDLPWLTYTVTEVKAPFLYDWCVERIKDEYADLKDIYGKAGTYELRGLDGGLWGVDAAYRLFQGDEAKNEYLLCRGDGIAVLITEWELTEEQMAVAGEKLFSAEDSRRER